MKKSVKLIIMAAALALLIGVYFIWQAVGNREDGGDDVTSSGNVYTVGAVDYKTLISVSVARRVEASGDGEAESRTLAFDFTLKEDETGWLWTENPSVPLSNEMFADMVTAVSGVTSPYKLENVNESDLGKYGLDEPEISLSFTDGNGTHGFSIGSLNSFSGYYYFCTEDKTTVYTVDSSLPEAFRFDIYDLIDTDDAPELTKTSITSIQYVSGSDKTVFTYYPNGKDSDYTNGYSWYASVNGEKEFAVASAIGSNLTDALVSLDFGNCVAYDSAKDDQYGLDAGNKLIIEYQKSSTVTDSTTGVEKTVLTPTTLTLTVGRSTDGVIYVRPEGSSLTAKLSSQSAFAAVMTDNTRSLRPTELILPDYTRIDLMIFTGNGKTLSVTVRHGEDDSVSYSAADGTKINEEKLQTLLTALAEAKTSAFASDLERDPSAGSDTVFSLALTFSKGDVLNAELTISRYSESYNLVSFMGSADRLITVDETAALTDALTAYFEG